VSDWSRAPGRWSTDLERFFVSPHCRDLLVISTGAFLIALASGVGFYTAKNSEFWAALFVASLSAIAWAFQAANLRFGAADIFASEILTICRISRILDFVSHLTEGYKPDGRPMQPTKSTQDYVVIFHNNSKDLEILDSNVVNWVTEFYVYLKATLDSLARLPEGSSGRDEPYKEVLLGAVYTAFLAFEGARRALMGLIDDKLSRQEAVLIALANEIPAYLFLRHVFAAKPDDIRALRIRGRFPQYEALMGELEEPSRTDLISVRIGDLVREVKGKWTQSAGGAPVDPNR
jgi:hypothetical protein